MNMVIFKVFMKLLAGISMGLAWVGMIKRYPPFEAIRTKPRMIFLGVTATLLFVLAAYDIISYLKK